VAAVVDVALVSSAARAADVCIVVDCIRASTVIAHALAGGYRRVICASELEQARAVASRIDGSVLGGERDGRRIAGFDLGNSPAEYRRARGETLVLTTTNGTPAIVRSARLTQELLCGALVNLDAVAAAASAIGEDVLICCSGVDGRPALDDTFAAGRYVERLRQLDSGARLTDAAEIALRVGSSLGSPLEALRASTSARKLMAAGFGDDLDDCARVSSLQVVPRLVASSENGAQLESRPP
jgi:2-phosphosulfolactate phosphatase